MAALDVSASRRLQRSVGVGVLPALAAEVPVLPSRPFLEQDAAAANDGPLAGVLVLDLCQIVSGPMAAVMLADQGANVIKVEPPASAMQGDAMRGGHIGGLFSTINRNKRSVVIDKKQPEGQALFLKLAAKAE